MPVSVPKGADDDKDTTPDRGGGGGDAVISPKDSTSKSPSPTPKSSPSTTSTTSTTSITSTTSTTSITSTTSTTFTTSITSTTSKTSTTSTTFTTSSSSKSSTSRKSSSPTNSPTVIKPPSIKPSPKDKSKQPVAQPSGDKPSITLVPPSPQTSLPLQSPPLVSTSPFDPLVNYTYIPPTMTLQPNGTSTVMRNGDAMERPLSTLVAPIVGGIAGFGLLAILFFCFTRRRRRQRPKHGHGRGFDFLQEDDTTVAEEPMSSIAEKHQSGQSYSAIPPRPPPPRPLRFSESFPDAGDPFMDPVAYMHPSDPAEYMHPSDIPEQERPISLYSTHSSIVGGHDPDEQPLLIQDNGRALPGYTRLLPPRRDRRRSLQQQLAHSQSSLAWEDTPSVAEVEDMAEIDVSDTQSIQGQNQSPQNQNRLARGKGGGSKRYSPGGMALGRSGSFGQGPIRPSSPLSRKME